MEKQSYFHICQKCHQIVDKVYQKGYCRACLTESFRKIQTVINGAHPRAKGKSTKKSGDGL